MRVLVTGSRGMLGSHIVEAMPWNHQAVEPPASCDLTDRAQVDALLKVCRPHAIIHAAGMVGGLPTNQRRGADLFYTNLMMGINVIDASVAARVDQLVLVGTISEYPADAKLPLREESLYSGKPYAHYGLAKLALSGMLDAYWEQHRLASTHLVCGNLYGPHDTYDSRSHAVSGILQRVATAVRCNAPKVQVAGHPESTRDLCFVADAARAATLALERSGEPIALNVASGRSHSIRTIATEISKEFGYDGRATFDTAAPISHRPVSIEKIATALGWVPEYSFEKGIAATVAEWSARSGSACRNGLCEERVDSIDALVTQQIQSRNRFR